MTLAAIQDIMDDWPGWVTDFDLNHADEIVGQESGIIRNIQRRTPLWQMNLTTRLLKPSLHRHWKARINALDNGHGRFYGYDLAGCYPILYPNGSWPTGGSFSGNTGQIHSVDADGTRIKMKTLPVGYVISIGDYLSFSYGAGPSHALHQAVETATADGSGVTPFFTVRPLVRTGAAADDVVRLKFARGKFQVLPGSVSAPADPETGHGTVSFTAIQVIE